MTDDFDQRPKRQIYSVTQLNREARALLESSFPLLWVEGEISNLARPSSGHMYFSLKDQGAQVRCAMFRNRNQHLRFRPSDGMQVLVRARVSLYEGRGEFQLIVEHMEEAGEGALRRAYEELKARLAAEGLFDPAHKITPPTLPQRIGVITSPTGAAIRDILHVLARRFPAIPALVYPVPVQGNGAAEKIAAAVRLADQRRDCDILLLARGGGSLEDLWAFNDEALARTIHACGLPVVTGIGHEIDFTIADFVADHRAPTPSAAAEFVSPDSHEWLRNVSKLRERLHSGMGARLADRQQRLTWLSGRLQQRHPGVQLRQHAQRLDELERRLQRAETRLLEHRQGRLEQLHARLREHSPLHRIRDAESRRAHLAQRLSTGIHMRLERYTQRTAALSRALDAVSPLATLGRGYAIVRRQRDHAILRDAGTVHPGERVEAELAKGVLVLSVDEVHDQSK
ncbi:MAG: exodeoxyribonuclease VII large subunit [Gammaproteobacteria bacterium]